MYDAAHAALIAAGAMLNEGTRTHRGLIGAFGLHVVQTNLLPRELGRALNEVEQIRLLADYTGDEISLEKAIWAVERAAAFIAAIKLNFPRS